jgi:hypothetical protein
MDKLSLALPVIAGFVGLTPILCEAYCPEAVENQPPAAVAGPAATPSPSGFFLAVSLMLAIPAVAIWVSRKTNCVAMNRSQTTSPPLSPKETSR